MLVHFLVHMHLKEISPSFFSLTEFTSPNSYLLEIMPKREYEREEAGNGYATLHAVFL